MAHDDLGQPALAPSPDDLAVDVHGDAVVGLDLVDEVLRHALAEGVRPHDEAHVPGIPGEVQDRLPGRVAPAEHHHAQARQALRLGDARAVVDAGAGERLQALDAEPTVGDPGGEDHRPGADRADALDVELEALGRDGDLADLTGEEEVRAEDPRLLVAALGELRAAEARGRTRGSCG